MQKVLCVLFFRNFENQNLQFLLILRVVSSVGLEHYLDRVGVTGSNPVQPTLKSDYQEDTIFLNRF